MSDRHGRAQPRTQPKPRISHATAAPADRRSCMGTTIWNEIVDALVRLVPHLIGSFVIGLTFYLAARARAKVDQVTGIRTAEYPKFTKVVGLLVLVGGAALLLVATRAHQASRGPLWFVVFSGALFLGSACMLLEFALTRATWNDYELTMSSPWSPERQILWSSIESVTYSKGNSWFVVKSDMGVTLRLHTMLGGLPSLLGEMRAKLAPAVYARAADGMAELKPLGLRRPPGPPPAPLKRGD